MSLDKPSQSPRCNIEVAKSEKDLGKVINGKLQTTWDGAVPLRSETMQSDIGTEEVKKVLMEKLRKVPEKETQFTEVKDSGKREEFPTGSIRDTREGKGRYDLLSTIGLRRLAIHYENGARKYSDRNWEKGQPLSRFLDSAMRHLIETLECKKDEDHPISCVWNMMAFVHIAEMIKQGKLPKELDDIGWLS